MSSHTLPAHFIYDGSFAGLLCVLRAIWQRRSEALSIRPATGAQTGLFGERVIVTTDAVVGRQVWTNLRRWLPDEARQRLYHVFLAEQPDSELLIYRYVREAIRQHGADISEQWADDTVRRVRELSRLLGRERHRMQAFVRFEQTTNDLYHATVEPDVNVLPLVAGFFARRYADQQWLIFDARRRYGMYYDGQEVRVVRSPQACAGPVAHTLPPAALTAREPLFQQLWRTYFDHATIAARRDLKRHRRHLPRRYWKHLTEKRPRPAA